jgi:hypothetical protein
MESLQFFKQTVIVATRQLEGLQFQGRCSYHPAALFRMTAPWGDRVAGRLD